MPMPDPSTVRAPELQPNLGWINTDKPLRISDELRGQVVLLDFWTYGCINCMHVIPDLTYLEEKYADQPFIVIGVHSAKFENEEDREKILAAARRYNIHHPVVVDDNMSIWNRYAVQAWPTFVLISPTGHVVGHASGEGQREVLDAAIAQTLDRARANNTLATAPLNIPETKRSRLGTPARQTTNSVKQTTQTRSQTTQTTQSTGATTLSYPGKVLADSHHNRLFIADTNHNRILITTLPTATSPTASLITTIGTGTPGHSDGAFATAQFKWPQGLALSSDGNTLYIADTNNHLLRAADLATSTVKTIAGTGRQSYDRRGGSIGTSQAISSPWALELDPDHNRLYIAMAGLHQLWSYDLKTHKTQVYAGSGRENVIDGPAFEAALAQPSGLALMNGKLYVADSEASAIREIDTTTGEVKTIAGEGLFVFGDIDGQGDGIRLQHPLGVAAAPPNIIITDTYNHKIKQINPASRTAKTLYGSSEHGTETPDDKPAFFEPGGLSLANNQLYIADTNNNRIIMINLETGQWTPVIIATGNSQNTPSQSSRQSC